MIDVWLDLKDKYELSFAKNDNAFGKAFNMKQSTDYKLAIGMYGSVTTVEILSFDVKQ